MMLRSVDGAVQPSIGTGTHWAYLANLKTDPDLFAQMRSEALLAVDKAISTNPSQPTIQSRVAAAAALENLGTNWHALFSRRFPNLPNGAAAGIFGMLLWEHLATCQDDWVFSGEPDPYGYGHSSTNYFQTPQPQTTRQQNLSDAIHQVPSVDPTSQA